MQASWVACFWPRNEIFPRYNNVIDLYNCSAYVYYDTPNHDNNNYNYDNYNNLYVEISVHS